MIPDLKTKTRKYPTPKQRTKTCWCSDCSAEANDGRRIEIPNQNNYISHHNMQEFNDGKHKLYRCFWCNTYCCKRHLEVQKGLLRVLWNRPDMTLKAYTSDPTSDTTEPMSGPTSHRRVAHRTRCRLMSPPL